MKGDLEREETDGDRAACAGDLAGRPAERERDDRVRDERRPRGSWRQLALAVRGPGRPDEPGGADRRRPRGMLLDGSVERPGRGRSRPGAARDIRHRDVPARRRDHEDRAGGRRQRAGDERGGFPEGGRRREGELPRLEGACRRPGDHARREARGLEVLPAEPVPGQWKQRLRDLAEPPGSDVVDEAGGPERVGQERRLANLAQAPAHGFVEVGEPQEVDIGRGRSQLRPHSLVRQHDHPAGLVADHVRLLGPQLVVRDHERAERVLSDETARVPDDVRVAFLEPQEPRRLAKEGSQVRADLEAARADGDLKELAPELEARLAELEPPLREALVPADPDDDKDAIVEFRQGVGGDEAALWAGDVYRMLNRYAEKRGLRVEELGSSHSDGGGFKEVTFAVKGPNAFGTFKWEGGTHRVQRVPETESQGRIHTSTATVAVMPEAEDIDVDLRDEDLKFDVYRSTGPGGQSVNTTDSAVRVTHLPTGLVVAMQDEKSQLQNKQKALRVLRARLYELERAKQQAELDATRRSQIGSGERAEKIRTYNFPESRVTDHRIKLTVHQLDRVLEGELDEFTEGLDAENRRRALGE